MLDCGAEEGGEEGVGIQVNGGLEPRVGCINLEFKEKPRRDRSIWAPSGPHLDGKARGLRKGS